MINFLFFILNQLKRDKKCEKLKSVNSSRDSILFFSSSNVTCLIESRYMSRNKKKKEEEEIIGRERGFN